MTQRSAQEPEEPAGEEVEEDEVVAERREEEIDSAKGKVHPIPRESPPTPASPAYKQEVHETRKGRTAATRIPSPMRPQDLADGGQTVPVPR